MPGKTETYKSLQVLELSDLDCWLKWLESNQQQAKGVWVKYAKKSSTKKLISYEASREGAIIYGWIDGLINSYTEETYLRKFTQRRPKSKWSKINRAIAGALIKSNRIKPSGLAQVKSAKLDGRWEAAYDSPSTMQVPPDLVALLTKHKDAKDFFDSLGSANRYALLYKIQNAKRPETRRRHLKKTIEMLLGKEVYHPKLRKKK